MDTVVTSPESSRGNGANSSDDYSTRTFTGVAPAAKLVNLRVLDDQGQGTGERRDRGDRLCDQDQESIRHTGHQPLARPPRLRELQAGPAVPGGGAGLESGHRGRRRRRERRAKRLGGNEGLRHDHLAGQQPLRDHRRRDEDQELRPAHRRPDRQLQLEGADADRPHRQAGPGRTGEPRDLRQQRVAGHQRGVSRGTEYRTRNTPRTVATRALSSI